MQNPNNWWLFASLTGIASLILWVVLAIPESYRFLQLDGKMKRGLGIYTELLPSEIAHFLGQLQNDVISLGTAAFVKKSNDIVLVQPMRSIYPGGIGFWSVGYINLSAEGPRSEYRVPIGLVALPIVVIASAVSVWANAAPMEGTIRAILFSVFSVIVFIACFVTSRARVLGFIRKVMQKHPS